MPTLAHPPEEKRRKGDGPTPFLEEKYGEKGPNHDHSPAHPRTQVGGGGRETKSPKEEY